jgi:hypothetical protein
MASRYTSPMLPAAFWLARGPAARRRQAGTMSGTAYHT